MSNTMAVTDANFASEIEQASGLSVVDFWAEWCGPCRMVGPIVDQLAAEYAGKVKVTKLDVDASPKTAMKYGVRSIPTILFFKDGKIVDQVIGFAPKPALEQKFKQHSN
ncbi:MAG: thioredoxin [Gemmatimonadaceae bacterium]